MRRKRRAGGRLGIEKKKGDEEESRRKEIRKRNWRKM